MTLLISPDLMIQSRVAAAAARAGMPPPRVIGWQQVSSLADSAEFQVVLIDLTSAGLDVAALVAALRERLAPSTRVIAFGPHVQAGRLAAAREAGCDLVLSRGRLDRNLEQILQGE